MIKLTKLICASMVVLMLLNANAMAATGALESKVEYDNITNTVKSAQDNSNIPVEELNEFEQVLSNKVTFANDIKTFTLYAFMNYTGYDDENNSKGYHPVRKMVREDLENMDLQLLDDNYYKDKGLDDSKYSNALREIGDPPGFEVVGKIQNKELRDLSKHLKEFYVEADIEQLYKKYKPFYHYELNKYRDTIFSALININKFLGIDIYEIESFNLEVNLLDAYWRASGLGLVDKSKSKGVIIVGPSKEPSVKDVVHEYLHGVINPITEDLQIEIAKSDYKMDEAEDLLPYAYNNWYAVVVESIVRSLAIRAVPLTEQERLKYIDRDMQKGFILTEYMYNGFDEFNPDDENLKQFIKKLLVSIDD